MFYKQLVKEFDFWDIGHKAIEAPLIEKALNCARL